MIFVYNHCVDLPYYLPIFGVQVIIQVKIDGLSRWEQTCGVTYVCIQINSVTKTNIFGSQGSSFPKEFVVYFYP